MARSRGRHRRGRCSPGRRACTSGSVCRVGAPRARPQAVRWSSTARSRPAYPDCWADVLPTAGAVVRGRSHTRRLLRRRGPDRRLPHPWPSCSARRRSPSGSPAVRPVGSCPNDLRGQPAGLRRRRRLPGSVAGQHAGAQVARIRARVWRRGWRRRAAYQPWRRCARWGLIGIIALQTGPGARGDGRGDRARGNGCGRSATSSTRCRPMAVTRDVEAVTSAMVRRRWPQCGGDSLTGCSTSPCRFAAMVMRASGSVNCASGGECPSARRGRRGRVRSPIGADRSRDSSQSPAPGPPVAADLRSRAAGAHAHDAPLRRMQRLGGPGLSEVGRGRP